MQHLDEGTIHAWLDGALTADEAARVDRHASECAACAAMVAEARGLVAGASRILSALDDVPAVAPREAGSGRREAIAWKPPDAEAVPTNARATRLPPPASRVVRRPLWSRPAVLAAAASVVLMAGTALIMRESPPGADSITAAMQADSALVQGYEAREAAANAPSDAAGAAAPGVTAADQGSRDGRAFAAGTAGTSGAAGTAGARVSKRAMPRPVVGTTIARTTTARTTTASPTARREVVGTVRDTARRPALQLSEVVTTAAPAVDVAAAQKAAPAPTPAPPAEERARRAAARRAAAAPARSEQAVPTTGREAPLVAATRPDTAYQLRSDTAYRMRTDTVTVSRVDTIIAEPPTLPGLRGAGRAGNATRTFPVTGCYEVVEGGLPGSITLTTRPAWSGAAEQRFVATAPGAIGYWSQPRSGAVHLVIAGVLVTARIDAATGELRGKAQRGGKSERFLARRGCR